MGVSMIEEAVILETLKICKGLSPGGPEERLFAEPSEEINTQINLILSIIPIANYTLLGSLGEQLLLSREDVHAPKHQPVLPEWPAKL